MNRAALLTITLLSGLATPLVVQATTPVSRQASASAPAIVQEASPAIVQEVAAEIPKAAEPACARKVKVVYAGYGESRSACPAETQAR